MDFENKKKNLQAMMDRLAKEDIFLAFSGFQEEAVHTAVGKAVAGSLRAIPLSCSPVCLRSP